MNETSKQIQRLTGKSGRKCGFWANAAKKEVSTETPPPKQFSTVEKKAVITATAKPIGRSMEKIIVVIGNTHTQISCEPKLRKQISHLLSYEVQGAVFARRASPYWDGRIRLLSKDDEFPTGLLFRLQAFLTHKGIQPVVEDKRTAPRASLPLSLALPWEPRDYQQAALEIAKTEPRGVFQMSVSSGKTATAAMVIAQHKVPTLFVTPDTGLREQAFNDFEKWFDVPASKIVTSTAPIVICNIQSLVNKDPKFFLRFKMLVIDELHHCHIASTLVYGSRQPKRIDEIYKIHKKDKRALFVQSWDGKNWVSKRVTNAFRYPSPKKLLRIQIQDEDGKIKEVVVTKNHQLYTPGGKLESQDLKVGDEILLGYTTHAQAMRNRSANPAYRKHLSERCTKNNKNRSPEIFKKQGRTLKGLIAQGKYNPYGRGKYGNGGELTPTQKWLSSVFQKAVPEQSVALKDGERPHHYLIDLAFPDLKVGIEIDGSSHKKRRIQDLRKEKRLEKQGWRLIRIQENFPKEELFQLKKSLRKMITSTI